LNFAPKGRRDEDGSKFTMAWVRHGDKYNDGGLGDPNQLYSQPKILSAGDGSTK
jgi:hypothetical protein